MKLANAARRIALLHPAVVTMALVAGSLAWAASATMTTSPTIRAIGGTLSIASPFAWSWAVFGASTRSFDKIAAFNHLLYLGPPLLVFVAMMAGWSTHNSPVALVFFAGLFLGLWRAAHALEGASSDTGRAGVGGTIVTTLLMYFAIVGVWVLRPKFARAVADVQEHQGPR